MEIDIENDDDFYIMRTLEVLYSSISDRDFKFDLECASDIHMNIIMPLSKLDKGIYKKLIATYPWGAYIRLNRFSFTIYETEPS